MGEYEGEGARTVAWPLRKTPGMWLAERVMLMAEDEGDNEGASGRKAEEADSEK